MWMNNSRRACWSSIPPFSCINSQELKTQTVWKPVNFPFDLLLSVYQSWLISNSETKQPNQNLCSYMILEAISQNMVSRARRWMKSAISWVNMQKYPTCGKIY
jgi:hypothetical protein